MADRFLDTAELHRLRAEVCDGLRGDVVEVGFGSGRYAQHFRRGGLQ